MTVENTAATLQIFNQCKKSWQRSMIPEALSKIITL